MANKHGAPLKSRRASTGPERGGVAHRFPIQWFLPREAVVRVSDFAKTTQAKSK
jgi:hypothetical protein